MNMLPGILLLVFALLSKEVQAAPPMEPCPPDSHPVEGICACDLTTCSKPTCPIDLEIYTNGTDIPGDCCPIYECIGCDDHERIEDKCPCAENAVLNEKGICSCIDPNKRMMDGKCECDENLCPLPEVCNKRSVPVMKQEGCCKTTICIECPPDSYPTNLNTDELEPLCSCYKCKIDCGTNEVQIRQRGTGHPGRCCDFYECVNSTNSCYFGNQTYKSGDTWTGQDNNLCVCSEGISKCSRANLHEEQKRFCRKDGVNYQHGEWWMEEECTNCTCIDGMEKCIAHFCDVAQIEGEYPRPACTNTSGSWYLKTRCQNCTCTTTGFEHCTDICDPVQQPANCEPLLNCNKNCTFGFKVRNGCEICKCNRDSDILNRYNISLYEFWQVVNYMRSSTVPPVIHKEDTNLHNTEVDKIHDDPTDYSFYKFGFYIIIIVLFALVIIGVIAYIKPKRSKSHNIIQKKYNPIDKNENHV